MEPLVKIENLSFSYAGSGHPALQNLNLEVAAGEFVTITGPSGCGKSTLALCLTGFIPHGYQGKLTGRVVVQGLDTRKNPPARLAGVVGLVQQDPETQLCTLKVTDEVAFGPENLCLPSKEIQQRVHWALAAVGAENLLEREVYSLSGGEKQRVAIASMLAMTPSLLILDEPTANLDPKGTREVLEVIESLRRKHNTTIIVIEHRLEELLPLSNRIVVMEQGTITSTGTPQEMKGKTAVLPVKNRAPFIPKNDTPLLSVSGLRVNQETRNILKDISFDLYPGEITAVMGDNGSGKTTLLLALLGITRSEQGKISLAGENLTTQEVSRRAGSLGLIFQNPNHQIFENTVYKEAQLPSLFLRNGQVKPERIEALLDEFGLLTYRDKMPFALSLGEKKRLNLVSVLGYSPAILILDEPLVGQDSQRLHFLMEKLQQHSRKGGLTIIVCHEPRVVAACCHRVLFLDQGKLAINAPTAKAFAQLAEMGRSEYLPS